MILRYKGNKPTKAYKDDVGFDLHPVSVKVVLSDGNCFTTDKMVGLSDYLKGNPAINDKRYLGGLEISKLIFDTGTVIAPEAGYWCMAVANSRVCRTKGFVLQNGVGIIDPGYRGTIKMTYVSVNGRPDWNDIDMLCRTCGQLIPMTHICPGPDDLILCEDLDYTERGENGHGSSDK